MSAGVGSPCQLGAMCPPSSSNSTVSCAAMLPSSSFRSSGTDGAVGGGSCSSVASSSSVSSSSSATTTTSSSTSSSSCDCRPYGGVLSLSSSDSSSDAKSIVASAARVASFRTKRLARGRNNADGFFRRDAHVYSQNQLLVLLLSATSLSNVEKTCACTYVQTCATYGFKRGQGARAGCCRKRHALRHSRGTQL